MPEVGRAAADPSAARLPYVLYASLLPSPPLLPPPQEIDFPVPREQDATRYDLDVGQRVFVAAPLHRVMAFDYPDIDGTAAVA